MTYLFYYVSRFTVAWSIAFSKACTVRCTGSSTTVYSDSIIVTSSFMLLSC